MIRRNRPGRRPTASAWRALRVREGAVGPLVFEFAAVRVWGIRHRKSGPPCRLLIRRSLGAEPELKYSLSDYGFAAEDRPIGATGRHRFLEGGGTLMGVDGRTMAIPARMSSQGVVSAFLRVMSRVPRQTPLSSRFRVTITLPLPSGPSTLFRCFEVMSGSSANQ
jgi:hypothetical protein